MNSPSTRAIVFIDGANLYHALKAIGVRANRVDPYRVARKLVEDRWSLEQMRYYIAEIDRSAPGPVYQAYRATVARLAWRSDAVVCTGHIQRIRETNPCARELASYLAGLTVRLPPEVYRDLVAVSARHREVVIHREKGVDVALACDFVDLGRRDVFDTAYLVSGDADFLPAVAIVRSMGKRVFVASPDISARLIRAADAAIRLDAAWFGDCVG